MVMVTKREAVAALLQGAMRAFQNGDDVCALTLAGAAEGALPEADQLTAYDVMRTGRAFFNNLTEKQAADELNFERNWLKHHNTADPDPVDVTMADVMLLRAMSRYMAVYGFDDLTREYGAYMGWPGNDSSA